MKANDKDKLYSLFQESKSMMPEVNLESCLMQSIKLAAEKKQQKMHMYYAIALVAALLAIVLVPLICLYFFGLLPTLELNTEIEIFRNMKNGFGSINFQSPFLFIPYVIFFLLIFDLLIRKRIWNKEHSEK